MQHPSRYWEGIYWEGLRPESVDAVPLEDANAEDDEALNAVLDACREYIIAASQRRLLEQREATQSAAGAAADDGDSDDGLDSYFVTAQERPLEAGDLVKLVQRVAEGGSGRFSLKFVCLLWHYKAFLGARVRALEAWRKLRRKTALYRLAFSSLASLNPVVPPRSPP